MKQLDLLQWPVRFDGVVSLEQTDAGVLPWRIWHEQRDLFHPDLWCRASCASGVRIAFVSDTSTVELEIEMQGDFNTGTRIDGAFDMLVDGELHQRFHYQVDPQPFRFENLPAGEHLIEIYLAQLPTTFVKRLAIDDNASAMPDKRQRRKWLAHGSSITHCGHAYGPSETWPALVARQFDLDLTNLGYGGQCHADPMVARIIRDRPADYISLCLGINIYGSLTLGPRSFREAAIGFIKTIRDGHKHTPIMLMSPIISPPRETEPSATGITLVMMRDMLRETVDVLKRHGDEHLYYIDGLSIMGEADLDLMPDGVHPNPEGYKRMAERYAAQAMPVLMGK